MRKEAGQRGASVEAEEEEEEEGGGWEAAAQEEVGRRGEGRSYFGFGGDWGRSLVG